jgi:hypothetical protein
MQPLSYAGADTITEKNTDIKMNTVGTNIVRQQTTTGTVSYW